jgi:hypothetical protein
MQEKKETHSIDLLCVHWSGIDLRDIRHLIGFKLVCAYAMRMIASCGLVVPDSTVVAGSIPVLRKGFFIGLLGWPSVERVLKTQ